MALTRRTLLAAMGAVSTTVAVGSVPAFAAALDTIEVDHVAKTLRFRRALTSTEFKVAMRKLAIPHRWLRSDSVVLNNGWRIATPDLVRGFGWTAHNRDGDVTEAWAELVVDSFDTNREFRASIDGEVVATAEGRLHFRCDHYPRVRLLDLAGGTRGGDHLQLLSKEGPIARSHRLVAVT